MPTEFDLLNVSHQEQTVVAGELKEAVRILKLNQAMNVVDNIVLFAGSNDRDRR